VCKRCVFLGPHESTLQTTSRSVEPLLHSSLVHVPTHTHARTHARTHAHTHTQITIRATRVEKARIYAKTYTLMLDYGRVQSLRPPNVTDSVRSRASCRGDARRRYQFCGNCTRFNQSINQSCIFRVVQVIKSLQDRLEMGIIYRGSVIMSGNEAWNRNVFRR